jgi:hypothetical protein
MATNFAMNFQPDSSAYEGIGKLRNVPDSVVKAFKTIRTTNNATHDKWLAVIFLKVYLDHLRCCHQGYELRTNPANKVDSVEDPLLYEFVSSTKLFDLNKRIEFINSGTAESWVTETPSLLSEPEVKTILAQIKPVQDSIAKGLYW